MAAIRSMKQYLSLVETRVKDAETIPEYNEPGMKVTIQNPKTKHGDQSAVVIYWRHGRLEKSLRSNRDGGRSSQISFQGPVDLARINSPK